MADPPAPKKPRGRPKNKFWVSGKAAKKLADYAMAKLRSLSPSNTATNSQPDTRAPSPDNVPDDIKRFLRVSRDARTQSKQVEDAALGDPDEGSLFLSSKRETERGARWELRAQKLTEDVVSWFEKEVSLLYSVCLIESDKVFCA